LSREGSDFEIRQLVPIVLSAAGIVLVVIGFIVIFPFQGAPTHAVYLLPSNVDTAIASILVGIVILMIGLMASILSIIKRKQIK
jgi:hypothetical protein